LTGDKHSFESTLTAEREQKATIQAKFALEKEQLQAAYDELLELKEEMSTSIQAMAAQTQHAEAELTQQRDELQSSLQTLQTEKEDVEAENGQLQMKLETLRQEKWVSQDIFAERDQLMVTVQELQKEKADIEHRLALEKQEVRCTAKQRDELESKSLTIQMWQEAAAENEKEQANLKAQIQSLILDMDQNVKLCAHIESAKHDCDAENERLRAKIADLEAKVKSLT